MAERIRGIKPPKAQAIKVRRIKAAYARAARGASSHIAGLMLNNFARAAALGAPIKSAALVRNKPRAPATAEAAGG